MPKKFNVVKKSCDILMNGKKKIERKMKINQIPKLKIKYGYKVPIDSKWQDNTICDLKPCNDYNVGIVCNKESGVIGLDLDFYTKKNEIYDPVNNPNHKLFIDTFGTDFIKRFDTYTQKTPNGGLHLIFRHHQDIMHGQFKKFKIDVRGGNSNGQLLLAGSVFEGKKYECINDTWIKQIPDDLLEFLKTNLFNDKPLKKYTKKTNKNLSNNLVDYQNKYSYRVPDNQCIKIINALTEDYFIDSGKWFIFTSAMKQINKKTLWDKYSKKFGKSKYNKDQNFRTWENIRIDGQSFYFESILKAIKKTKDIRFYRYLPIPKNKFKAFNHINIDKLSKELTLEDKKSYCIKSDTGTGKTTLFKQFIKETQSDFISITSRRTLAKEQYEDFLGICENHISYYEYDLNSPDNQGLTICIDSILKLKKWDFKNKIIFLDEFNSIIEYLLDTDTLAKNRDEIFNYFINDILMECKAIICVDADISDLSIQYLKEVERIRCIKFNYIQNDYIHNKGTLSTEIHEHEEFMHQLSKEDKWLLPCDSKKQAKNLWEQLTLIDKQYYPDRDPIIIIMAEEVKSQQEFIRLNEHKRIIYSPKIVYGLDSNGYGKDQEPRPVYSYYEMNTISPSAMLQQINRERKISHHYYFIYNKNISKDTIICEDDFKHYVNEENSLALKVFQLQEQYINQLFCSLLYYHEYKQNCYKSNPSLHFKLLLKERGFVLTNDDLFLGDRSKQLKENKKENAIKYDIEHYDLKTLLNSSVNEKVLHLYNTTDMMHYRNFINDSSKIQEHLTIKHLFTWDNAKINNNLNSNNDFAVKKLKCNINKINFTRKILDLFNMNHDFTIRNLEKTSTFNTDQIIKEYKTIFRDRSSLPISLKTNYDKIKFVASKLYSKLNIPMVKKDIKQDGKHIKQYALNEEIIKDHKHLMTYASRHYEQKDLKYIQSCHNLNDKQAELKSNVMMALNGNNPADVPKHKII